VSLERATLSLHGPAEYLSFPFSPQTISNGELRTLTPTRFPQAHLAFLSQVRSSSSHDRERTSRRHVGSSRPGYQPQPEREQIRIPPNFFPFANSSPISFLPSQYTGGMVTTWNKFCFTGGYYESEFHARLEFSLPPAATWLHSRRRRRGWIRA